MTFIVNILHNDFSLLVADRKATTNGPTTITLNNITIHSDKGANIIGFTKIHVNSSKNSALGVAGDANEHKYIKQFLLTTTPDDSITTIDSAISAYLKLKDRKVLVNSNQFQKQEGILTFFDEKLAIYFSLFYDFSFIHKSMQLYRAPETGLHMLVRGSGCDPFSRIVSEDVLNKLAVEVKQELDFRKCIKWLSQIYCKISQEEPSVSKSIIAWVSRRSTSKFHQVSKSQDGTYL